MVWKCIAVLPNIRVECPIECGPIAITSSHDERVTAEVLQHPRLSDFLSKFYDAHGVNIPPGVVIWDATPARPLPSFDALCSFRDAVALSHVLVGRASAVAFDNPHSAQWTDYFWIYPWMLNRDYSCIVCRTPAMNGMHELESFRGQASPELSRRTLTSEDLDRPLFNAISQRWRAAHLDGASSHTDTALFRSLNMAFRAGAIPAGMDDTIYDYGRSIALWVSAFEILAHPGSGRDVSWRVVYELLERASFVSSRLSEATHSTYDGRQKRSNRILACWLYGEIYQARNDFLHGNPLSPDRLIISHSGRHLLNYPPALYRIAMSVTLGIEWALPMPSSPEAVGQWLAEKMSFEEPQKTIEHALVTCLRQHDGRIEKT